MLYFFLITQLHEYFGVLMLRSLSVTKILAMSVSYGIAWYDCSFRGFGLLNSHIALRLLSELFSDLC